MSKRKATGDPEVEEDREVPADDAVLESLPKTLTEREAELDRREEGLDKREEDLSEAEKEFANETAKTYGSTKPEDILTLNVGGTHCQVLRSTLCYAEGSLLASMFSGRWDGNLTKDETGAFFIDQPYKLFGPLVDFLRACKCAIAGGSAPSIEQCSTEESLSQNSNFIRMIDHYGLESVVFPVTIDFLPGEFDKKDPEKVEITQYPERSIKAFGAPGIFRLSCPGHNRNIKAVQIALEEHKNFQIYFGSLDTCTSSSTLPYMEYVPNYDSLILSHGPSTTSSCFKLSKLNELDGRPTKNCRIKEGKCCVFHLEFEEFGGAPWLKAISANGDIVFEARDLGNDTEKFPCYPDIVLEGAMSITNLVLFP